MALSSSYHSDKVGFHITDGSQKLMTTERKLGDVEEGCMHSSKKMRFDGQRDVLMKL